MAQPKQELPQPIGYQVTLPAVQTLASSCYPLC